MFTKRILVTLLMLGVLMGQGAATQPTSRPFQREIADKYNAMPRNLWPSPPKKEQYPLPGNPATTYPPPDELPVKTEARAKWLSDNKLSNQFANFGPWIFSGKLQNASSGLGFEPNIKIQGIVDGGRNGEGKSQYVTAEIEIPKMVIWDKSTVVTAQVILTNVKPGDAIEWKRGMDIAVTAKVDSAALYIYDSTLQSPVLVLKLVGELTQK